MDMLQPVTVHKMVPDGSEWAHWRGFHLPVSASCPTIWTPAGSEMHWRYATWRARNTITFLWPDRWYVIHAYYDDDRRFAGCYCDIVTPNPPLASDAAEASYLDLYVDVVVGADRSVSTKDEEVYRRAERAHPHLAALRERAFAELEGLAEHARAWSGPFAPIGERIVRADWHDLDPLSAAFGEARQRQWSVGW